MLLHVSGVNYNVNSNYKTLYNSVAEFLRSGKFPLRICEPCGATYRWLVKHIQFSNSRRKHVQIDD